MDGAVEVAAWVLLGVIVVAIAWAATVAVD